MIDIDCPGFAYPLRVNRPVLLVCLIADHSLPRVPRPDGRSGQREVRGPLMVLPPRTKPFQPARAQIQKKPPINILDAIRQLFLHIRPSGCRAS